MNIKTCKKTNANFPGKIQHFSLPELPQIWTATQKYGTTGNLEVQKIQQREKQRKNLQQVMRKHC
jgi:hypothetical protein